LNRGFASGGGAIPYRVVGRERQCYVPERKHRGRPLEPELRLADLGCAGFARIGRNGARARAAAPDQRHAIRQVRRVANPLEVLERPRRNQPLDRVDAVHVEHDELVIGAR
jgi:hypothetical protein